MPSVGGLARAVAPPPLQRFILGLQAFNLGLERGSVVWHETAGQPTALAGAKRDLAGAAVHPQETLGRLAQHETSIDVARRRDRAGRLGERQTGQENEGENRSDGAHGLPPLKVRHHKRLHDRTMAGG